MDFKRLLKAIRFDVILLVVFTAEILYMSAGDFIVSFKPAVSFEEMLDGKEVKAGTHVKGDIPFVIDYFATETSYTQYKDGSRSGGKKSGRYYLIPTAEGYIGLKGREADVSELEKLADETYDYLMGGAEPTTVKHFEGSVEVMEAQLVTYYREYLADMGYTQEEMDAMGDPLVIEFMSIGGVRGIFAIGLVLLAITIFLIRRRYKRLGEGSGLKKAEDLPGRDQMIP